MPWYVTGLLTSAGLLLIAVALPLVRRRIPPNAWYGVRLPATFADERVWYEVNARSGRDLAVLGAAVAVLALAVPVALPGWPGARQVLAVVAALLVGTLLLAVRAVRHAGRLRQVRNAAAPAPGGRVV